MIKQFLLIACIFSTFHIAMCDTLNQKSAEQSQATLQNNKPHKPQDRDTAPIVVGTLLQGIIPHLIQAVAANEADDAPNALNHCAQACQAWGNLFTYLSRTIKRNPKLPIEQLLKKYFSSTTGKHFIQINRKFLIS